jgi:hypothetical protein
MKQEFPVTECHLFDQITIPTADIVDGPRAKDWPLKRLPSSTCLRIAYSTAAAAAALSQRNVELSPNWNGGAKLCSLRKTSILAYRCPVGWVALREKKPGRVEILCHSTKMMPLLFSDVQAAMLLAQCCHPSPHPALGSIAWMK